MTNTPAHPKYEAKVIVVSDGVAAGTRQDKGAPALQAALETAGLLVVETIVTPDGTQEVAETLRGATQDFYGLVVTTGGTGFGPRDQTPEGTKAIIEREAPGLAEAMRLVNPLGRLSRGVAGVRRNALILNVPGSPKGAVECLEAVIDVVPHALELLAGKSTH
ncbi:MAG: MogA/MoaB family molybdenum cofactor biosynthesis protein [Acidimicrobiales bacterium]|nr:MogA/MoaB family molybdenum cofactor biosynthesis protein [Acidimicrobiales bacterium]